MRCLIVLISAFSLMSIWILLTFLNYQSLKQQVTRLTANMKTCLAFGLGRDKFFIFSLNAAEKEKIRLRLSD